MNVENVMPIARPFGPELEIVPVARASGDAVQIDGAITAPFPSPPPIPEHFADKLAPARTDHAAVASAVCGMTAVIPIVSQIAGLGLGLLALVRISRARRAGVIVGGRRYAITGIISSGLALAGWIAFGGMMFGVNKTLAHTLKPLTAIRSTSK